jgi:hypothetical protein
MHDAPPLSLLVVEDNPDLAAKIVGFPGFTAVPPLR